MVDKRPRQILPAQPTPLIGRERDVAAACTYLSDAGVRLLTFTGPAGIGKTRLAVAVAERLLDGFADGVFFVDLASIRDPALVAAAIAQSLEIREAPDRPPFERLMRHLQDRRVLLVLDNFEQVPAAAPQIADLLAAHAGLVVLTTSRVALHLRWEQQVPVAPLAVPSSELRVPGWPRQHSEPGTRNSELVQQPERLLAYAAVRLFVERARAVQPGFLLSRENAAAVAGICAGLDGLPLAIELAAARSGALSTEEILTRLEPRLDLLVDGAVDLPVRQQTLRGAIGWSYDLLTEEEQRLFRRLGVFAGGFTPAAATAVAAAAPSSEFRVPSERMANSEPTVLDRLLSLLDKSLVRREDQPDGRPRFQMFETIREYALEQLVTRDELETARRHHTAWCLALAERAEPELTRAEQQGWMDRLEREHDNLRAALSWCTTTANGAETALRLAAAVCRFWEVRGHIVEGRQWLERALTASGSAPSALRAKALNAAGNLARAQGDLTPAVVLYEESLRLLRTLGEKQRVAVALNNLGVIAQDQGDYGRAATLYDESLAIKQELGDTRGVAISLNNLGMAARYQGDHELAAARHQESLALFKELPDAWGTAMALSNLGAAALAAGEHEQAAIWYRESLALRREIGDRSGLAWCLAGLAGVAVARGQPEPAARLLGAADALREEAGVRLDPSAHAEHDRLVTTVRARLGEDGLAAMWGAGRVRALDEVVSEALALTPRPPLPSLGEGVPHSADATLYSPSPSLGVPGAVPPSGGGWGTGRVPQVESVPGRSPDRRGLGNPDGSPIQRRRGRGVRADHPGGLTDRELEILHLLAGGQTNKEIAATLVVSVRTVENHRAAIYRKTGTRSRAELVAYVHRL